MITDIIALEAPLPDIGAYAFRDESVLGTRMQLLFVADTFTAARDAAMAVRAQIDRLDLILNGHRPDSELSALNDARVHFASPELFEVVAAAERWLEMSQGAFSGRLGRIIDSWRESGAAPPDRTALAELAAAAAGAHVRLDIATRSITRPEAVRFALDAIAKGWIVDRAFQVARSMPAIRGALIDIGGDVRCGGTAPSDAGWTAGIPDPRLPFDNAPLVATAHLSQHAVATSGRGPRDRSIGDARYSPTLSPYDGWPISHHVSTSVIATSTADADALATALLVLPTEQGLALADEYGAAARIEITEDAPAWTRLAQSTTAPAHFMAVQQRDANASSAGDWQSGWQALATFTAPRRQLIRDPQFRSPYMAMWITDVDNKPVRTLILVGKRADWQRDNFIWWSMHRDITERLVSTRSMSTSGAGVYNVFWDGVDDAGKTVAAGKYVLHVETSRERGKHTHRSLTLDFGKFERFKAELPPSEEGGGLRVSFDHY